MWRAIVTRGDGGVRAVESLDEIKAILAQGKETLWLDIEAPEPVTEPLLRDVFALDPLAIDDCIRDLHQPKADDYGEYIFLAAHGVGRGGERGQVETIELDLVIGKKFLISHRTEAMRSVVAAWDHCGKQAGILGRGPASVAREILDTQALNHVEQVEALQADLEEVEDALFAARVPPRDLVQRLFHIKADLARLRRVLGAQRELLQKISRGDYPLIPLRLRMGYRDVYDVLYRATETVDLLRDIAMAVLETHLTLLANRTNDIMKVLTVLATFFLPFTVITGWYGMNFAHMPALHWRLGELYVLGLFAVVTVTLALYLWRFIRR